MNIQEQQKIKSQLEAAFALLHAITAQLDRHDERLDSLENKRGPGRPPKLVETHASD
jgi:hypothetical protein